ncbi:serine hydrolase domain-containing protein [Pontimicrobium aquaticum]|uniref:Beta-lactamase family protein n=1 Tax=Pontimicrobium aquaticum TaxID=2565367 RepID=A0A4U0F0L6_9FLAO|nr:serine hydrolase domain-containing protein [Pontimicrobium aquaticum]TJY37758.1 beta-lactamase family protein [Pontimicrobium aquaticum]
MKNITFIICILILLSIPAKAQTAKVKAIDEFIEKMFDSLEYIPSISIGIVHNGKIVHKKAYGFSDVKNSIPATTSTQYYIASTTKSFTALASVLLEEKGLLDFNKSLEDYFSEVNFPDSIQAHKIKIPDLLGHTSGIDNCGYMTLKLAYTGAYTYMQLFELMNKTCGRLSYGTYRYSNLGYNIMNLIFLKELGKTWKEVVQEEVLDPIGMAHTYSSYVKLLENKEEIAVPYNALGNGKELFEISRYTKKDATLHAAGGLYSSVDDVLKWLLIQVNNGKNNNKTIISPTSLFETRKIRNEIEGMDFGLDRFNISYGLGWNIAKYKGKTLYHHGGAYTGYLTMISYMPETKSGVVVMVNDSKLGHLYTNKLSMLAYDAIDEKFKKENKDWEEAYYNWLKDLKFQTESVGKKVIYKDFLNRSKRKWNFSVPKNAITGIYKSKDNENVDLIRIFENKNGFSIKQGEWNALVEPYKDLNTIRVQFIRPGVFKLDVEGEWVKGFSYDGNYYQKM